eukprot:1081375-Amphidinium_carterae.1
MHEASVQSHSVAANLLASGPAASWRRGAAVLWQKRHKHASHKSLVECGRLKKIQKDREQPVSAMGVERRLSKRSSLKSGVHSIPALQSTAEHACNTWHTPQSSSLKAQSWLLGFAMTILRYIADSVMEVDCSLQAWGAN